jgi:hypothetical protein
MHEDRVAWIARRAAWVCIAVLAILSWTPGDEMIRTGAPGDLEHVAAYLITGSVVAVGYSSRLGYWLLALLLCAWAGVLETGQLWVPGRHAQLIDFAASSIGAILGISSVAAYRRWSKS